MGNLEEKTDTLPEREFHIWSEGYAATGEYTSAHYHGIGKSRTFNEACENFFRNRKDDQKYFNADSLTYWGCKLYDNEGKARERFG